MFKISEKWVESWYMDIVKNLKDYKLSHKQKIFAGFLKENVDSYTCNEAITNRAFMREYFAPDNDFVIYSTAVAEPAALLIRRNVG